MLIKQLIAAEHSIWVWLFPAELYIQLHGRLSIPLFQNIGSERCGYLFVENAFFLEMFKGICIQGFCPFIGIISC